MKWFGNLPKVSCLKTLAAGCISATSLLGTAAWAQQGPLPPPPQFKNLSPARSELAIEWLDRISRSARELPYTGVFVHQTAEGASSTRITHLMDRQGVEHEKIEPMDGPVSEIIRRNDEMICYRPETRTISIDRRATGRFFPSLITGNAKAIAENYNVKLGNVERIAGFDCQWVILEPKDAMRYMQKLCAELGTGLLLRAKLYNDRKQVVEQFMFTQLDVTRSVAKNAIKSRYEQIAGWQKEFAVKSTKDTETGWQVGNLPAGFRKVMEMTRNLIGRPAPVSHLVFSDGVLSVSVFVETAQVAPNTVTSVLAEDGPTSFAMRAVADHQVTVMGEVPLAAVQSIADGVSRRR
jgi:sigma-E factor negative regulatory protein RseB